MRTLAKMPGTRFFVPALLAGTAAFLAFALCGTAAGCRGAGPDPEALIQAFEKIHRSIYDVYSLTDPDRVFDLLSRSLAGEELERQVYEYLKCLKVQAQFNTRISIADVIYNDVRITSMEKGTAVIYCKWVVIGKVRHPTHIHRKTNLNEALYKVRLGPEGPRIVGYDLVTNQELEVTNR